MRQPRSPVKASEGKHGGRLVAFTVLDETPSTTKSTRCRASTSIVPTLIDWPSADSPAAAVVLSTVVSRTNQSTGGGAGRRAGWAISSAHGSNEADHPALVRV
jgi:hypothetical protein